MKFSKYIIAFILFFINSLIISIFSINSIPAAIPTDNRLYFEDIEKIDFSILEKVAEKNSVVIYAIADTDVEFKKSRNVIYTFEKNKNIVWNNHLGLNPGKMKDILGNNITLTSEDFYNNKNIKNIIKFVYLIGEQENCLDFYNELISSYNYNIKLEVKNYASEYLLPYVIFIIILIILLFVSYVDSSLLKKEISIRVIHGESAYYHYFKYCILNSMMYTIILISCILFQKFHTQILNCYFKVYNLFLPFLIILWIISLHLIPIKPKEIFYGHQFSKKILIMLRIMKNVTAVICCGLIFFSLTLIPKFKNYNKGDFFFQEKGNYYFLSTQLKSSVNINNREYEYVKKIFSKQDDFYKEINSNFNTICIQDISNELKSFEDENYDYQIIYCNHNALEYLEAVYPETSDACLEKYDAVILFPNKFSKDVKEKLFNVLYDQFSMYEGYRPNIDKIQTILYNAEKDMLCFGNNGECSFTYYNNCAIIIASDNIQKKGENSKINYSSMCNGTLYEISSIDKLYEISNNYNFEPIVTELNSFFEDNLNTLKSIMSLIIISLIIVIMIYISVTYIALKLDYQINSKEYAIKKILGYSIIKKNQSVFAECIGVWCLNIIFSFIYVNLCNLEYTVIVILIPLILLLLNILLIICVITRNEATTLTKVLKGGAL